jgi:hypothetical protein
MQGGKQSIAEVFVRSLLSSKLLPSLLDICEVTTTHAGKLGIRDVLILPNDRRWQQPFGHEDLHDLVL